MTPKKPPKTKTFIVYQEPDAADLAAWEGGHEYKEGDQIAYEDQAMECRKPNSDKKFDQKKWGAASNEFSCTIRQPGFEELNMSLSSMANLSGALDFGGGGKFLYDTCAIDPDPEFESDGLLLLSLCLKLGNHYLRPYNVEVKKN